MVKNKEGLTKVFTGVGVLVIAILVVWGALNVARLIPAALSGLASAAVTLTSVFIPSNEGLTLSPSNNVVDIKKPFTLSWNYTEGGTYSLSYSCTGDLAFEVSSTDGLYVEKECDTTFEVIGDELRVIPISSNSRFLDALVKLTYTKADGTSISDESVITVVNEDVTNSREVVVVDDTTDETTLTPGERTDIVVPISGSNSYSNPNGRVDLAARVISTGVVDIDTNKYTATDTITSHDRVGIKFEIENLGTKESGTWEFTVVLPTQTIYFYNSETQRSLNPGDKIEFTIGFDGVKTNDNVELVINVDPGGYIGEASEENNILRHRIEITNIVD